MAITGLKPRRATGRKFLDELAADLFIRLKERARLVHGVQDYDPLVALADIALDRTTPQELAAKCHTHLAKFFYAERAVVDVNHHHEEAAAAPEAVADAILARLEQAARARTVDQARQLEHRPAAGNAD